MPNAASALDQLISVTEQMARTQKDSMDQMLEHFSTRTVFASSEKLSDFKRRERLRQKEYENAKKGLQSAVQLTSALEDLEVEMKKGATTTADSTAAVKRGLEDLQTSSVTLSVAQGEELEALHRLVREGNTASDTMQRLGALTRQVGEQEAKNTQAQGLIVEHTDSFARALQNARDNVKNWVKENVSFTKGFQLAVDGAKQSFEQIESSLSRQVPIMDSLGLGLGGLTETAAAYGLSVNELMVTQDTYSQAILAASGNVHSFSEASGQYLKAFKGVRESLYNLTGDYDKASELFGATVDLFSYSGVKESLQGISDEIGKAGGVTQSLKLLTTMTNKTAMELTAMNKQILEDREIRSTMIGMDKNQRKARVTDMLQYQALLVQKGLEIDQAVAATAAMEKLTASVSPKERYKQAAKIRAIAGASGIQGGDEFMRLSMKKTKTAEEKSFLQDFATKLDTKLSTMQNSENLGEQFTGGAFQDTVSGSVYDAMVKAQSSAGLEGRSINEDTVKSLDQQTNQLQGAQETMKDMKQSLERIAAWGDDAGVKISGGIAIGILAGIGKLVNTALAAQAYQMAMGGGAGGAAGAASKLGGVVGKVAGVAIAFEVGQAIGTAIYDTFGTQIQDALGDDYDPNEKVDKNGNHEFLAGRNGAKIRNTKYQASAVETASKFINDPTHTIEERQNAQLKMMMDTGSAETKARAEAIKNNTEAMKRMADLMEKGMAANQAAATITKENTAATKANTEGTKQAGKSSRTYERRDPMRNSPPGSQAAR